MTLPHHCRKRGADAPNGSQRGFTLIEIAVVLFIIGLLAGGLLPALTVQLDNQRHSDVRRQLTEIKRALIGWAQANNGRFPCPDCRDSNNRCSAASPNDGGEDYDSSAPADACMTGYGSLPWNTLGVQQAISDPWGNRFSYYLHTDYDGVPAITLTNRPSGTVRDSVSDTELTSAGTTTSTGKAIIVILSHGKNRIGGVGVGGAVIAGTAGNDEAENNDGDETFIAGVHTEASSTNGKFDDVLTWLSASEYNYHMVQAGVLP